MKILISADMEGASGIANSRETGYPLVAVSDPQATPDYLSGRKWLTADINAAVEGAVEAGAASFVLHDSHGTDYRNVVLDDLHPAVAILRGRPIPFLQYEDLNESYDALFLIAMHARAGQPGILSHVLDWPLLREVRINSNPVGESQITAALAGHFGIPTVLISGDNVVCEEMIAWTGDQIETAVVKESLSRYAVRCLPLCVARRRIHEAACRAVARIGLTRARRYEPPITLEVDFGDPEIARYASWIPETSCRGDSTVSYVGGDFASVYKALLAMFWVATSKLNP